MPTQVNPQITDAVVQANTAVLGESPALAIGSAQQAIAHAVALAMHNAVSNQQNLNVMLTATLSCSIAMLQSAPDGAP
jgi:fumarate hydratase class II